MRKMRVWFEGLLDTPFGSPRGRRITLVTRVIFVLFVLFCVFAYSSWATKREIVAVTTPWGKYGTVEMTLRSLGISELEILLNSGYQRDGMKLLVFQSVGEEGGIRVISNVKYFILP